MIMLFEGSAKPGSAVMLEAGQSALQVYNQRVLGGL